MQAGGPHHNIASIFATMERYTRGRLGGVGYGNARPGHADLAGSVKWLTTDCRETLERASARETSARVAAGALARCLLDQFGIEVFGFVRAVGPATASIEVTTENWRDLLEAREASD